MKKGDLRKLKYHRIPKQYLGAFKAGHRQSTREFIDEEFSYVLLDRIIKSNWTDKEAMNALAELTQFNNEHYKNVFDKNLKTMHSKTALSKTEVKTNKWGEPILDKNGNTIPITERQACYRRENAKNRDIISRNRDKIDSLNEEGAREHEDSYDNDSHVEERGLSSDYFNTLEYEDMLIDMIDNAPQYEAVMRHADKIDKVNDGKKKKSRKKKVS